VSAHIIVIHAVDLIQEREYAVIVATLIQDLDILVHINPTLCEVLDEAFKSAVGMVSHETFINKREYNKHTVHHNMV